MKKKIIVLAVCIFSAALLGGCGSKIGRNPGYTNETDFADEVQDSMTSNSDSGESFEGGTYYKSNANQTPENDGETTSGTDMEKKIIRNAQVELLAKDVEQTYASILVSAKEMGGSEFSAELSQRGDYKYMNAQIKIPAGKLDEFLEVIKGGGDVISYSAFSDNITDRYNDAQIRLTTKKASLEQYYKLLKDAKNLDEVLKLQREIDSLTEDIEALEGRINMWNKQVAESTVTLLIQQKDDPDAVNKDIKWDALSFSDMGWIIANGFVGVLQFLYTVLIWILIALAVLSPLWVPAAILVIILCIMLKKKKKKRERAKAGAEQR